MNNLVAIVGRPNVGKSTLFNRLTETREAITDDTSGTTRDRKYGKVIWTEHQFNVIDTGGWITKSDDSFEAAIRGQVEISLEEADLILFMVEIEVGITDLDQDIANLLRRTGKPVMLVCNKVDTSAHDVGAEEFYRLGLADEIYRISANNGYGTGELLDAVVAALPRMPEDEELGLPKLAVVGKPNVGKSTFINTILGEERNIVTDIAGPRGTACTRATKCLASTSRLWTRLGCGRRSRSRTIWSFTAPFGPSRPLTKVTCAS